jgi:hypothetical protein
MLCYASGHVTWDFSYWKASPLRPPQLHPNIKRESIEFSPALPAPAAHCASIYKQKFALYQEWQKYGFTGGFQNNGIWKGTCQRKEGWVRGAVLEGAER